MLKPRVSIVLNTYNGASRGYLVEAIESVLAQNFADYELIIVDDGSTDETKSVCEPYLADPRVHYIFQQNGGPAKARNKGINTSSGAFICFLDDDDIWRSNKLQRQINFIDNQLSNSDNWGMVFTWAILIDPGGNIIGYRNHYQQGAIYKYLLFENIIDATSSVLIKREVFDTVGLFDEIFKQCEDWDMWIRIARSYYIYHIREYLVQYREHETRLSTNNEEAFFYETAVLKKALSTAPPEINSMDVYASSYINRSVAYFSFGEYHKFREMFIKGARISPKLVTVQHIFLLIISFLGDRPIDRLKSVKQQVHKRWIARKVQKMP